MNKKYCIIGLMIIIIDQFFKFLMINKNIIIIPNLLSFTYTQNNGAAFGIGTKIIIIIASITIIIGIIIFILKEKNKISNYIPYMLILFGSIGNLIDRIFRGYVIDFIDIKLFNFPNFNIADICITVGVVELIVLTVLYIGKEKNRIYN